MWPARHRTIALLGASAALLASAPSARADAVERELEAAFLLQFARFAEWKNAELAAADPFVFTVLQDAELKTQLADLASTKKVKGRRIEVDLASGDKPARRSHVVVIHAESDAKTEQAIKALKGCACLLVTFRDGFARKGAAINFVRDGASLKFEVSMKNASKEQIELSPDLARLGTAVD